MFRTASKNMRSVIIFALILVGGLCEDEDEANKVNPRNPRDSYLDAYSSSHGVNELKVNSDRQYTEAQGYPFTQQASQPNYQYGQPAGPPSGPSNYAYGPPAPAPAPAPYPAPQYPAPAPAPVYGQPAPVYGPPAPVYGPPAPVYGPPQQPFYGMPHALLGIFEKLKYKLDLFVLGKIILKLVIFKKIMAFIAILLLLLFIPSFKHKGESNNVDDDNDDDAMMRQMQPNNISVIAGDERLNNMSRFVLEAIENFSKKQKKSINCDSIYCKTSKVLRKVDRKLSYKKLVKLYSKELQ